MHTFPSQIRRKSISNQLRGLLEVEPLHFTCYAASEATRVEKMDSAAAIQASTMMDEIMFEPMSQQQMLVNALNQNNDVGVIGGGGGGGSGSNTNPVHMEYLAKDWSKPAGVYQTLAKQKGDDYMNNVKNILSDQLIAHKKKTMDGSSSTKQNIGGGNKPSTPSVKDMMADELFKHLSKQLKGKIPAHNPYIAEIMAEANLAYTPEGSSEPVAAKNAARSKRICEYVHENISEDGSTIIPWHKLLTNPSKQMIVVDRMHSGARRFVTLDFGQPVMLTDILVPACEDLVSLAIDIWCFDEDNDSSRLLLTGDIGSKTIVLSDMQPPPICRFVKLTITGRYGISAPRCKIPIGQFFGHVLVLDNDGYAHTIMNYIKTKPTNLPGQLKALHSLYEDVHCRYSLSSSKLTELLDPLFNGDISNVAHMQAYLNQPRDGPATGGSSSSSGGGCNGNCSSTEPSPSSSSSASSSAGQVDHTRIMSVYEECISFQHQLNIIQNVIRRLDAANRDDSAHAVATTPATMQTISSDKLRVLSECLLDLLLNYMNEYGSQVGCLKVMLCKQLQNN